MTNPTTTATDAPATRPGSHGSGHSAFGLPRGALGWLAGALMARINAPLNALAVEMLDVTPEHDVLEVGFGHGWTVERLAERARFVAGADPSAVMVRQATRRNRAKVRAGRVALAEAAVEALPFDDARFDRALAVNCFQHWDDAGQGLAELHRVLRPGGCLVLGLRMHDPDASAWSGPGFTEAELEAVAARVAAAGLESVREERRRAGREVVFLIATR